MIPTKDPISFIFWKSTFNNISINILTYSSTVLGAVLERMVQGEEAELRNPADLAPAAVSVYNLLTLLNMVSF